MTELIDARGLVEADLDSQVRAHIEAQSATIAGLRGALERIAERGLVYAEASGDRMDIILEARAALAPKEG